MFEIYVWGGKAEQEAEVGGGGAILDQMRGRINYGGGNRGGGGGDRGRGGGYRGSGGHQGRVWSREASTAREAVEDLVAHHTSRVCNMCNCFFLIIVKKF